MNTIDQVLENKEIIDEIVSTLNEEVKNSYVFSAINRQKEMSLSDISDMKFSDLTKEEKEGVSIVLGRILESVIPFILARQGMEVRVDRNSDGDMVVDGKTWEIKGTVGTTGWQGSTHSTKKEDNVINFVGAVYGINPDVLITDILDGTENVVSSFLMGAWAGLDFARMGEATSSNSRTMLKLPASEINNLYSGLICGNMEAKAKWITFKPTSV